MALKFEITGDNSNLLSSLDGARDGVRRTAQDIEESGMGIENMFKRIGAAAGIAFSLNEAKSFYNKIKETRSYFQDIESSMKVFLGNEEAAQKFTDKLKDYAYYNMFEFSDLANASKQMIAYGHAVEDVIPRLDQLSNIATGTNANLMEMVNLYNNAKNIGNIGSQGLASWATRGLVVKDVLKEMGVEVKGTTVSFEQLNMVLDHVTAEGGMFHDLMLEQMENISAEEGQLEDNLAAMYNEIGENMQGVITGIVKAESFLVDHYKEVGVILAGLVSSYGLYRTALVATRAVENAQNRQRDNLMNKALDEEIAKYEQLLGKKKNMVNSDLAEAVAKGKLSEAQAVEIAKKREMLQLLEAEARAKGVHPSSEIENLTAQLNDQKAIVEKKKQEWEFAQEAAEKGREEYQSLQDKLATQEKYIESLQQGATLSQEGEENLQQALADRLDLEEQLNKAKESWSTANENERQAHIALIDEEAVAEELNTALTEANTVAKEANATAETVNTTATEANTVAEGTNTTVTNANTTSTALNTVETNVASKAKTLFSLAINKVSTAFGALGNAIKANPIGFALTGITMAISLFTALKGEVDETTAAMEEFTDAVEKEINHVASLYAVLSTSTNNTKAHKKAQEELKKIAEEYGFTLKEEIDLTKQLKDIKDKLISTIKEEAIERAHANMLKTIYDQYESDIKKVTEDFTDKIEGAIGDAAAKQFSINFQIDHQELVQEAGKVKAQIEALQQELSEKQNLSTFYDDNSALVNSKQHQKVLKEIDELSSKLSEARNNYDKLLESSDNYTKVFLKALGQAEGDENKYSSVVQKVIDKTHKFIEKLGEKTQALSNSSDASNKAALAVSKQEVATEGATATMSTLITVSDQLIKQWAAENPHMKLTIDVDASQVKEWMKSETDEQLKRSINARIKALEKAKGTKNNINIAGREKTQEQAVSELRGLQAEAQRRENVKKPTTTTPQDKDKKKKTKTDNVAKEKQRLEDMQDDLEFDRIRAAQELEQKLVNARLEMMADGEEKVRQLQEQQNKEELDDLERQKEDAVKKYIEEEKKIFEQKEKIKKAQNENYKEKKFDESTIDTSSIAKQYDEIIELTKSRQLRDAQQESLEAMRNFLKEYGSFEQQRLATTQEYEEKIAKATTQGEKLRLQKEKEQKLGSLQYQNIAAGIDWKALFSGVGSISKEMMKPMMEQLLAYTKTDEYLDADSQTQSEVANLIQEIRQYLGTDQSMTWQALATATQNFTQAVGEYNEALAKEQEAVRQRDDYAKKKSMADYDQTEYERLAGIADQLGAATANAKDNMQGFATVLNDTSEQVTNFTSGLTAALNNMKGWKGVEGFGGIQQSVAAIDQFKGALDSALPSMGAGMGKTIAEGLSSTIGSGLSSIGGGLSSILSTGLGQTIGFIAQIPRLILDLVDSVKSFVTGVLDSFTELISLRWIDDLVVSITDAIGNLINAIFDLPENLYHVVEAIVVKGIGGLLNTVVGRIGNILSFGLLDSGGPASWFTNSNAEKVAKAIENLTDRNELLQQAIEDLTDEMKTSRGAAAIDISRRAEELQKETNENYKRIAEAQAGYHNNHHSFNYYWSGYSQEQIARLSKQIGRQWNGDIWDLSPEEMKILRSNVDMWEAILNTGKGGYGERVAEKLQEYIEQAGKLEEITNALYENLTTTTKDNVFDDFLNSLYDLADGSDDVMDDIAKNWQSMVNKMVINNLVGANFQKKLEEWYKELAKLNLARSEGDIDNEEYQRQLEALQQQYKDYVEDAQSEIEEFRKQGIIKATDDDTYKQEASSKGFKAMSQDTGEELNGRFTALQIAGESMASQAVSIYSQMLAMSQVQTSSNTFLSEIRNMMITGNSYLEDIAKYSKKIYNDFAKKLNNLVDNTKNL